MSSHGLGRRRFLRTATVGAAGTALGAVAGYAAAATDTGIDTSSVAGPRRRPTGAVKFRWLGTSGWRIDIADQTLLIDPYLTRFPVGLAAGRFNPTTPLTVDPAAIDPHVGTPKHVFVTHTHWDHFNDVPHIATQTGARVYGTLSTYHLAQSYGIPGSQLSVVKGGEVFDFGTHTVEVIGSLHSRNAAYSILFPGVHVATPDKPATIADLPEGDTLNFQVNVTGGPSVFFMGASDYVTRNLKGLAPDVAMIALNSSDATYDYVGRLMRALDNPATVVPVHWDNFESPLKNPPTTDDRSKQRLDALVAAVRRASPTTKVVIPEYLTPYTF